MYLKKMTFENLGPIQSLHIELPFYESGLPKPLVLVGANGSGKTTVLSCIVNALLAFKQQVFDESEVELGKVFRLRSSLFRKGGSNYYHANLIFEENCSFDEWFLDRPRFRFEKEVIPLPISDGWRQIPEFETNDLFVLPSTAPAPFRKSSNEKLGKLFSSNTVLFFPSDRFEPPDWLNEECLTAELRFPDLTFVKGLTSRRIFRRSQLGQTLDWIQAVLLDMFLSEREFITITNPDKSTFEAFYLKPGKNGAIFRAIIDVLAKLFNAQPSEMQLDIEPRTARRFTLTIQKEGQPKIVIPNLLSMSAGQSALFCIFCSIIRDFELSGSKFNEPNDVRGIVIIDEADLHLHMKLQNSVLPELISMFPKVQFIITTHSPLLIMGMSKTFSQEGFQLLEMPSGQKVHPEAYAEFVHAFEAFGETSAFQSRLIQKVQETTKPLLLVEGKTDRMHLEAAWAKLNPDREMPFIVMACGDNGSGHDNGGGAQTLKLMLEIVPKLEGARVVGLFDNDRAGAEQFKGLNSQKGYQIGVNEFHRIHLCGRVHSVILPIPASRKAYDESRIQYKMLELEHYYSDDTLRKHDMLGHALFGSQIFPITDAKNQKSKFAEEAASFVAADFAAFAFLFEELEALTFSVSPKPVP